MTQRLYALYDGPVLRSVCETEWKARETVEENGPHLTIVPFVREGGGINAPAGIYESVPGRADLHNKITAEVKAADALSAPPVEPTKASRPTAQELTDALVFALGEFHRAHLHDPYPVLNDAVHTAIQAIRDAIPSSTHEPEVSGDLKHWDYSGGGDGLSTPHSPAMCEGFYCAEHGKPAPKDWPCRDLGCTADHPPFNAAPRKLEPTETMVNDAESEYLTTRTLGHSTRTAMRNALRTALLAASPDRQEGRTNG